MKIEDQFDIEKMSEETGISIALIKETLNIPLETNCIAKTIFEAQKDFRNAIPDSENKLGAFKLWLSLITTTSDAQKAHKSVPKDSIYEFLAYNIWHRLSMIEVKNIKSLSGAKKAFKNAPPFSQPKFLALKKCNHFSLIEVNKIVTLADAKRVHKNALPNTSARLLAQIKIIEFTTTLVAARKLYDELSDTSKTKLIVFHLWHNLSLQEVDEAKTLEEMLQAYQNAPDNSELKNLVIEKILVFFVRNNKV